MGPLYNSTCIFRRCFCIFFFSFSVFSPPFLSPLFFALAARGIFYGVSSFPVFLVWCFILLVIFPGFHIRMLPLEFSFPRLSYFLLQKKPPGMCTREACGRRPASWWTCLGGRCQCYFVFFPRIFRVLFFSETNSS